MRATRRPPAIASIAEPPGDEPETAAAPRPPRVLVVDDDHHRRQSLVRQLETWGAGADGATDGPRAVERLLAAGLGSEPYDLVLVDQGLPAMDGLALAETIAALPGLTELGVVLLTSGAPPSDDELRRAAIVRCLSRPAHAADLHDCVAGSMAPGIELAAQAPAQPGDRGILGGASILMVEDNPVTQHIVRSMLENLGARVEVAGCGSTALDRAARQRYDLILMDCRLPVIDGYEATRQIRRRERSRQPVGKLRGSGAIHTPIIALTANDMRGDRERCLAAGMDDFLSKAVLTTELRDCLERWLPAVGPRSPGRPRRRQPRAARLNLRRSGGRGRGSPTLALATG